MSQHDYIIADAAGSAFLADLNLAVKALAENNYGTTEPAVMYAHMWWADTTTDILKQRNAANTGWLSRYTLSTGALINLALGTPASGVLTNCTGTAAALNIGGNAATVTVADAASDTTTWPMLARSQTGNQAPATDAGLTYNASTNTLTATTFDGALAGNSITSTNGGTSGSFTITGTGFSIDPTATANWYLNNNVVTLYIPNASMNGTSDSTTFTLSGLPAGIRPTSAQDLQFVLALDNSSIITARAAILAGASAISLYTPTTGSWTASGTKRLNSTVLTWTLD